MITRSQMRRQLRAQGGIMSVAPREKFGIGSTIKDRIRKLIPNELADVAVKAAPFIAPFYPGYAAIARGLGRFDQRGSISDALKQGAATYVGGKGVRALAGAQGPSGGFDTFSMEGFKERGAGRLFQGGEKEIGINSGRGGSSSSAEARRIANATDATKPTGIMKRATEATIDKLPFTENLPQIVKEKLLVGGITSGASALYSYFTGEFEPQEPGETMEEYLVRRNTRVKQQMRGYMDSYYTPLRNPQYAAMSDEEKNNYIDSITGQGMATGGRVGYQTGGISMTNTMAQNRAINNARRFAANTELEAPRERIRQRMRGMGKSGFQTQAPQGIMNTLGFTPEHLTRTQAMKDNPSDFNITSQFDYARKSGKDLAERSASPFLTTAGQLAASPFLDVSQAVGKFKEAGQYPDMYDPNKTLPVEPQTDQDLIEGFAKFKEQNPDAMSGAGMAALVEGVLPGGAPITFSGSVESNAFNKYLESLGLSRADIVKPRENIEGGGQYPDIYKGGESKLITSADYPEDYKGAMLFNQGGRVGLMGGSMPMGEPRVNQGGITELDFRAKGGFVPVGIKEKADDVPAMLSKNEFVFTADAVRGAGNGSIENGAQKMYDTMKNLERRVT